MEYAYFKLLCGTYETIRINCSKVVRPFSTHFLKDTHIQAFFFSFDEMLCHFTEMTQTTAKHNLNYTIVVDPSILCLCSSHASNRTNNHNRTTTMSLHCKIESYSGRKVGLLFLQLSILLQKSYEYLCTKQCWA